MLIEATLTTMTSFSFKWTHILSPLNIFSPSVLYLVYGNLPRFALSDFPLWAAPLWREELSSNSVVELQSSFTPHTDRHKQGTAERDIWVSSVTVNFMFPWWECVGGQRLTAFYNGSLAFSETLGTWFEDEESDCWGTPGSAWSMSLSSSSSHCSHAGM